MVSSILINKDNVGKTSEHSNSVDSFPKNAVAILFRRSLIYQTKEFFQNSTLHGVRYIAETGRPIGEKFMWFCFTTIGLVTALIIIMSLWEKFQTNPTITGLDTDFINEQIIFPTTVICPNDIYDADKGYEYAFNKMAQYDNATTELIIPFLELLTKLSFDNIQEAYETAQLFAETTSLNNQNLRELVFQVVRPCEKFFSDCKFRDEKIDCCANFEQLYTERGFCYAFNSRFKSTKDADVSEPKSLALLETDKKWSLFFRPLDNEFVSIFPRVEYFGIDFKTQMEYERAQEAKILISKKSTYTTEEAEQLSIKQRKCIFDNEVKLDYFNGEYTFSSCMKECRMKKSVKLCKCIPPFYKPIAKHRICTINQFACLQKYRANITNIKDCHQCELNCNNNIFSIDKLTKNHDKAAGIQIEFLTWPIIRYKREVLFGWVDLLVSFGGIAGLFLGFSLLSGVEILYYFTMRACCMVYQDKHELYKIEKKIASKKPPRINMSFKRIKNQISSKSIDDDFVPIQRVATQQTENQELAKSLGRTSTNQVLDEPNNETDQIAVIGLLDWYQLRFKTKPYSYLP